MTCSWKKAQIVYEDQNGGVADDDDDDDVDDDDDDDDGGGGAYQQILRKLSLSPVHVSFVSKLADQIQTALLITHHFASQKSGTDSVLS